MEREDDTMKQLKEETTDGQVECLYLCVAYTVYFVFAVYLRLSITPFHVCNQQL